MGEISTFPNTRVHTWRLLAEHVLQPRLASLGLKPEVVEHVVAKVRTVYDSYDLGGRQAIALTKINEASLGHIRQVWEGAADIFLPLIVALLWEVAVREVSIYQHNAGARAKTNNPLSSTADVIDFPSK